MMKITVFLLLFVSGLLTMHDIDAHRAATQAAADRAGVAHQLERLQTDVSDLKQSVDALGVACMTRRDQIR